MNFYKITNEEEFHNGIRYKTGLNVDVLPFNPLGDCESGGIYFAREDILAFGSYGKWIRQVTIPKGDKIYKNPGTLEKWKACRVILGKRRCLRTEETLLALIKEGAKIEPWVLQYIENQPLEICLAVVNQDGLDLEYVRKQTPEICLAAVTQNGHALEHVKKQTPKICLAAVKQNGLALGHVKKQTSKIRLASVKQNGHALIHIIKQTPEICLAAVTQNGRSLHFINKQTSEICLAAVTKNKSALEYVINQTPEICLAAKNSISL